MSTRQARSAPPFRGWNRSLPCLLLPGRPAAAAHASALPPLPFLLFLFLLLLHLLLPAAAPGGMEAIEELAIQPCTSSLYLRPFRLCYRQVSAAGGSGSPCLFPSQPARLSSPSLRPTEAGEARPGRREAGGEGQAARGAPLVLYPPLPCPPPPPFWARLGVGCASGSWRPPRRLCRASSPGPPGASCLPQPLSLGLTCSRAPPNLGFASLSRVASTTCWLAALGVQGYWRDSELHNCTVRPASPQARGGGGRKSSSL